MMVMRLTAQRRTRALTTWLSLMLVPLFAYANFLCAAGSFPDEECAKDESAHHEHGDSDHHQQKDCSKDSCFCATMSAVTSPQTIVKPDTSRLIRLLDLSLPAIPNVVAPCATLAYEHGPPGIAPPIYLHAKTVSPRSPPLSA